MLSEIDEYENRENEKHVQVLAEQLNQPFFAQSADGQVLAIYTGKEWFIVNPTGTNRFNDGKRPDSFVISANGRYIVYTVPVSETKCKLSRIDLGEHRSGSDFKDNFTEELCTTSIAAHDDGSVYFTRNTGVIQYSFKDNGYRLVINDSFYKPKYPKLGYKIFLASAPDALWLLFGAAGDYDLYQYSGNINQARKIYPAVASPHMQLSAPALFAEDSQNTDASVTPTTEPLLFFYTGEAGRYSLQGFTTNGTLAKAFQLPIHKDLIYLTQSNEFLYVKDGYPVRFSTATGSENRLPIKVSRFFVHNQSLIMIDPKNRLLQRNDPYTEFEKKLFQIKEELESILRQ